jgi:hypothetical protein
MKKHSRYYYSLLISCLIIMSSCQPKPSSLLKEAMKMEKVSTDSIFFYLQQIAPPRQLSLSEQGDYYLLQEENNATTIAMSKGKYNFLVILGIN